MELIEPLKKELTLPRGKMILTKVGSNHVYRYESRKFMGIFSIRNSTISGLYELESELDSNFKKIYLKVWGQRSKLPDGALCLKQEENISSESFSINTKLSWLQGWKNKSDQSPDRVVSSWRGLFRFNEDRPKENILGLRRPQLGALHAISGYFATDKELDPATVVLPTGTGKTETMISLLVYQQCKKMLVLVPSDSLRSQISNKFLELGYLAELGVLPYSCELPYVAVIKKGLKSSDEALKLVQSSNVIVATSSILSSSDPQAVEQLCKECTHLVVDEAHHISAKTWHSVRDQFKRKRVIQFTATPFRNDGANLGGKIIYNYTMGEAQKYGYFTNINLSPVEEYFDNHADESIAKKSITILKKDIASGLDHLLMARVKSKSRAEKVYQIYIKLAPDLNPIVVHSDYTKTEIKKRLNNLITRESKIVVCVDMLGEGYDLPNLKIAAIHDHHKSLAVTLQFVGRFTRSSHTENIGESSVVMNIADPQVEGKLQNLYSQGADWDIVLRRLSEDRIDREIRLQNIIESLKAKGDLHNQISLWNLHPSCSAILFNTSCDSWKPLNFMNSLPKFDEVLHSISDEENLLVLLAVQSSQVKWGDYKELKDTNYKLLIAHWDKDLEALFIFSNDYQAFRAEKLAEDICEEQCKLVCGEIIFNIFNGIEYPLARNLGASQIGAISFTQYFGPNVTEGLSQIEQSQSSLSNIAALGYEDGERVIWGCSQRKGKIWSPQKGGNISDWLDWVKRAWSKVNSVDNQQRNITKNFLRPIKISSHYNGVPISGQWGEQLLTTLEDKVSFLFGEKEVPFYSIDLIVYQNNDAGNIYLRLVSGDITSVYKLKVSGEYDIGYCYKLVQGEEVLIVRSSKQLIPFPDFMGIDPVMIYYDDGSFSYNCFLVKVPENIGQYSQDDIEEFNWGTTNIRKESMGYRREIDSIQYQYFKSIEDDFDIIINDDGSGESADLVGIKDIGDEILLSLFHCKYSSKDESGARLSDLYEVCGQAQRSIRWKHLKLSYLYNHVKHREKLWREKGYSRFLKGDMASFSSIKNKARTTPINFSVSIIQPGVQKNIITEEMLKLLGSTALYIKKTTMAELIVIGS